MPTVAAPLDDWLLDAGRRVLEEHGWDGLQVDRVAAAAGISRVTAWRQGASREALVVGLLNRLDADYRSALWSALTAPGSAARRLESALRALWDVADRHLHTLLASDNVLHHSFREPYPQLARTDFLGPFIRLLRDGNDDASLRRVSNPVDAADALFNTACWGYVHLRGRHGWSAARARKHLLPLLLHGVVSDP